MNAAPLTAAKWNSAQPRAGMRAAPPVWHFANGACQQRVAVSNIGARRAQYRRPQRPLAPFDFGLGLEMALATVSFLPLFLGAAAWTRRTARGKAQRVWSGDAFVAVVLFLFLCVALDGVAAVLCFGPRSFCLRHFA